MAHTVKINIEDGDRVLEIEVDVQRFSFGTSGSDEDGTFTELHAVAEEGRRATFAGSRSLHENLNWLVKPLDSTASAARVPATHTK